MSVLTLPFRWLIKIWCRESTSIGIQYCQRFGSKIEIKANLVGHSSIPLVIMMRLIINFQKKKKCCLEVIEMVCEFVKECTVWCTLWIIMCFSRFYLCESFKSCIFPDDGMNGISESLMISFFADGTGSNFYFLQLFLIETL